MAETVSLISPQRLKRNPENPRLVFHESELDELQQSIRQQGILVPLTVYQDGRAYYVLDGERRWRCAIKLGLDRIPVIIQPKPSRLQNIMMMFAIHNARKDWDPLPSALKLEELESEFEGVQGRKPTEQELAQMGSMSRGEVRRLRNLLRLPARYRKLLLEEIKKPRAEQQITADHVLEATRGASALQKRGVIDKKSEGQLSDALLQKFRTQVIDSTVAPRKLARIARAVERDEISKPTAARVSTRLIKDPEYSVDDAFTGTVEQVDFEHGTEQLVKRVVERLQEQLGRGSLEGAGLRDALKDLASLVRQVLRG